MRMPRRLVGGNGERFPPRLGSSQADKGTRRIRGRESLSRRIRGRESFSGGDKGRELVRCVESAMMRRPLRGTIGPRTRSSKGSERLIRPATVSLCEARTGIANLVKGILCEAVAGSLGP